MILNRQSRMAATLVLPVLAFGGLIVISPAAHGATRGARAKQPAGSSGDFARVTTVPHSSDVWTFGFSGTVTTARLLVAHRHGGKWQKVKAPNMTVTNTLAIAAGSTHTVWLGGAATRFNRPAIFKATGKKFTAAKLPKLNGDSRIQSISASSGSNAWAVGRLVSTATSLPVALHWNGKAWSAVATPEALNYVSTSGPTNAWAVGANGDMMHWDGKTWTADGTAPTYATLSSIATSSSKVAYAVGQNAATSGTGFVPLILRLNGSTWSPVKLPKGLPKDPLTSVTIHGKAAWTVGRHVILHSAGGAWKTQQKFAKNSSTALSSVSTVSAKHPWAVGARTVYINGVPTGSKTIAETYQGHSWKAVASQV